MKYIYIYLFISIEIRNCINVYNLTTNGHIDTIEQQYMLHRWWSLQEYICQKDTLPKRF